MAVRTELGVGHGISVLCWPAQSLSGLLLLLFLLFVWAHTPQSLWGGRRTVL